MNWRTIALCCLLTACQPAGPSREETPAPSASLRPDSTNLSNSAEDKEKKPSEGNRENIREAFELALEAERRAVYDPLFGLSGDNWPIPKPLFHSIPKENAKWVHLEIEEGMHQTKRAANHQLFRVRFVTLKKGAALRAQVRAALVEAGLILPQLPEHLLPNAIEAPEGKFEIQLSETPANKPSAVNYSFSPKTPEKIDLHQILPLIPNGEADLFLPILSKIQGFEWTRRHARKPGLEITDQTRLSLLIEAQRSDLEKRILDAGFQKSARNQNLYERQQATVVLQSEGDLQTVHFQTRWTVKEPEKSDEGGR